MMLLCVPLLLLLFQSSEASEDVDKYNMHQIEEEMCFLTAVSSNHLHTANGFLRSLQQFYPCAKTYIYDLGLTVSEKKALQDLPYVVDVMELILPVRGKDYFPSGSCAFKPPMITQFIDKYRNNETSCRFFFYGDSVIYFHHKFNRKAFDEVLRRGIVAQSPRKEDQISMTHPKMFPYFGFDREWLFHNQRKRGGPGVMRQVQAGLMLVDAANTTMRETFFQEWVDCAVNDDCLIPDKVKINKNVGHALAIHSINGTRVFRAHRDDQSAFSFLIAKYFGYGVKTTQQAHLDSYVHTLWRQRASHQELINVGENCSHVNHTWSGNATTSMDSTSNASDTNTNTSTISGAGKHKSGHKGGHKAGHKAGHKGLNPSSEAIMHPSPANQAAETAAAHTEPVMAATSRHLLMNSGLIQFQAVLDFVGATFVLVVLGVLFGKWKLYWESDLYPSVLPAGAGAGAGSVAIADTATSTPNLSTSENDGLLKRALSNQEK